MILVNCDCGCFFTLRDTIFDTGVKFSCANCKKEFLSGPETPDIPALKQVSKKVGMTIRYIPDNAKITISFDA